MNPASQLGKMAAGALERAGSASEAIVYAGKHRGEKHRILFDTGNLVTLIHEPSGDTLTVHGCDVEYLLCESNSRKTTGQRNQATTCAEETKNAGQTW